MGLNRNPHDNPRNAFRKRETDMRASSYQMSVFMFYALDVAFEENSTECLRSFLLEANLFLWRDKGWLNRHVRV